MQCLTGLNASKRRLSQYSELIDGTDFILIATKVKLKKRNGLAASIGADQKPYRNVLSTVIQRAKITGA